MTRCFPKEIRDVLVCPRCHGPLTDIRSNAAESPSPSCAMARGLTCDACGVAYPIVDGLPVLLVDAALPRDSADG